MSCVARRLTERSQLANVDAVVRWEFDEAIAVMEEGRSALWAGNGNGSAAVAAVSEGEAENGNGRA